MPSCQNVYLLHSDMPRVAVRFWGRMGNPVFSELKLSTVGGCRWRHEPQMIVGTTLLQRCRSRISEAESRVGVTWRSCRQVTRLEQYERQAALCHVRFRYHLARVISLLEP